ncbi:glutathione S-transferase [Physcomitrium patens]|uniref:glutathione transferase n=1 Tax=Physcomitrium patens TaxID=3218 RepID=A9RSP0_PHYPA|nr:glutathione S-transferase-like [Physcomitrium patens]XP_024400996.1 glutathione S-transferase-like [Physcomitrium patens]XP_024400998.1 glutathione S-transferase-like [Physcomitrium patens]XP_024400999.1 glutathione S-transferase-like [Physcomitrium patens]AFZ39129.1 phi class glutathione S-transferase [Physcomitrium patens]PNR35862.1 hypothetical protein PHYPA_021712 [Physcomitrium patens]|eukprot:XP_024400995.1 glutathione S-transferase-like [Physcomitrella patens]
MAMILYGGPTPNVIRSILPLFEAEVDTENELKLVRVALQTAQHRQPIYTTKQPFGQIPFFEDGDVKIFESRAIARYIAEKYEGQGTPLLGKSLKERAIIYQWIESEGQNFHPCVGPVVREMFVAPREKRPVNEEVISTCLAKLNNVLNVYEAHLAKGSKFIAGESFSLADAFHTPYMNWVKNVKPELLENRPHVSAWVEAITSRPAFQKCLQLDWENAAALE